MQLQEVLLFATSESVLYKLSFAGDISYSDDWWNRLICNSCFV